MTAKDVLGVRLPPDVKRAIRTQADRDGIKNADWVRTVLQMALASPPFGPRFGDKDHKPVLENEKASAANAGHEQKSDTTSNNLPVTES